MAKVNRPVALVTGASSGIGADLAREAARDGHDLVLSARRREPMLVLAEELKQHGAASTIVEADLGKPGAARFLFDQVRGQGLDIDVLINNAGLGSKGRFDQGDIQRIEEMLQVNVTALTELTRLALPAMLERRRGRVMLVASTASFQPGPQMAVYFATKAYVLSFGAAIAYELRGTGVTVTTVCPGATATGFAEAAQARHSALFAQKSMMSSQRVAQLGYRAMKAGRRVAITGWLNYLMALFGHHLPHALTMPFTDRLMRSRH